MDEEVTYMFEKTFPASMQAIVNKAVDGIPELSYKNRPVSADFGTEYQLGGGTVYIPYRIYLPEIADSALMKMSDMERTILHCVFSRSHDGHVREKHIKSIVSAKVPDWAIPYIVKVCDEYVLAILRTVYKNLKDRNTDSIKQFCAGNRTAFALSCNRMISYWNEYHRQSCFRFREYAGYKLFTECFGAEHIMKRNKHKKRCGILHAAVIRAAECSLDSEKDNY